jgi:hypothetical protein
LARNQRPSFLKRQKEQKRNERAAEKREARRLKRKARADGAALSPDASENPDEIVPAEDEQP